MRLFELISLLCGLCSACLLLMLDLLLSEDPITLYTPYTWYYQHKYLKLLHNMDIITKFPGIEWQLKLLYLIWFSLSPSAISTDLIKEISKELKLWPGFTSSFTVVNRTFKYISAIVKDLHLALNQSTLKSYINNIRAKNSLFIQPKPILGKQPHEQWMISFPPYHNLESVKAFFKNHLTTEK